jgi:hypothetical protein
MFVSAVLGNVANSVGVERLLQQFGNVANSVGVECLSPQFGQRRQLRRSSELAICANRWYKHSTPTELAICGLTAATNI